MTGFHMACNTGLKLVNAVRLMQFHVPLLYYNESHHSNSKSNLQKKKIKDLLKKNMEA